MGVPLNDLNRTTEPLYPALQAAMEQVMRSGRWISGPTVDAFESEFAKALQVSHAIGVSSGTDALLAVLMALDIAPGDEVITTPFTFIATAEVIFRLGARPVFVDIEADSFNIQAEAVADAVTDRTKTILPVHLFGRLANMTRLVQIGETHGIPVVEDSAQSVFAKNESGQMAGTMGIAGCFSFFPAKNLGAMGDAGGIVTNDASLEKKLRSIRVHGSVARYAHDRVGGNFRLDSLQAAILSVKLPYLQQWTQQRRDNAQRYRDAFVAAGLTDTIQLPLDGPGLDVINQFVIRVPNRDGLRAYLSSVGIETAVYYPTPLHLQPCFAALGYRPGEFPVSEKAAQEVLALPIFPGITEAEQTEVVEQIAAYYRNRALS